ncbi:MAG: hypothetical protein ABSA09_03460 [Desulfobaccales bacterium]|jgi:hypothetical protein
MSKLELELIENALDFIQNAVENLNSQEPKQLKYAIINFACGVELLLKARLAKEDWRYLFQDILEADYEIFFSGNFRSIDIDKLKKRLKKQCNVDISIHNRILSLLQRMRNKLVHFKFSGRREEVESLLVKAWSFAWDFIHDQLLEDIEDYYDLINNIREMMRGAESFVSERIQVIQPTLDENRDKGNVILSCPGCLQDTLIIPGDVDPFCLFCRYSDSPENVADEWASEFIGYPHTDPKERMVSPVLIECGECGSETMIEFEDGGQYPPNPAWVCFTCGMSGPPVVYCQECGEAFPWEEDVFLCPDCQNERLEN